MRRKWFRALFRQRVLVILLLTVQASVLVYLIFSGSSASRVFARMMSAVSVVAAMSVIARKDNGAFKLTWVFLILLFPLFGGAFYLLFAFQTSTRRFAGSIRRAKEKAAPMYLQPGDAYSRAKEQIPDRLQQVRYLQKSAGFPVYGNTRTQYLSPGEKFLESLLQELETAEKYIFLEYFIVQEGVMWNAILDVLRRKAAQGVLVRVIYDDLGCFLLLPQDYPTTLRSYGIECAVFNPFLPLMTAVQNNRDHRKIAVIDGIAAYTGGANLADEYINAIEKHGHWKDSAVLLRGKAAWSMTLMFLEMWALCSGTDEDFAVYYPWKDAECIVPSDGFVLPYAASPMDAENVGERVYLQIINSAREYVYINTPYLIVDDGMVSALSLAARSGVDVRIITPGRWDRWLVHMTTRSYYRELIGAGVKIYEYSEGFMHAKSFVSDDVVATVGTANLDFRSLYLHFECGVWMHGSAAVAQVKADFLETLCKCRQVTRADCASDPFARIFQDVLRLFAPLM